MVQLMSAPETTLPPAMVTIRMAESNEPNIPVLPLMALLASVHEKPVIVYPATAASVSWTCKPRVVTLMAEGTAGPGLAKEVSITAGAVAMLTGVLNEKFAVPPTDCFVNFTAARVFLIVQVKSAPATTLPAGMVTVVPLNVPNVPVLLVTALLASTQLNPVSV
jgi:hypothetical protein